MKNLINLKFFSLLLLFTLFISCQKEDKEFIDETNDGDTISVDSNLTALLRRASQNNGSLDNIIDGSSCIDIMYPIEVVANGQKTILESEEDIDLIVEIFGIFPNDDDIVEIIFPINVMLEDYSEITIDHVVDFQAIVEACDGVSNALSCVEFMYPINIFVYNELNEQTGTVSINSDSEWFDFLLNLEEGTLFAINYPMSAIVNGNAITVNSNQNLIAALQAVDCDVINDPNEPDPIEIEAILTEGTWFVNFFFDDWDNTSYYSGYEFTFHTDGTSEASNGNGNTSGTWTFEDDNPRNKLDLFFGNNAPLNNCNEDWSIEEINQDLIRLKHVSGDGSTDYLTYSRQPYQGGGSGDLNEFISDLTNVNWYITLFNDSGDIETCDFIAYQFHFDLAGTVTATSSLDVREGYWIAEMDSDGEIDLILSFNLNGSDDNFEDLIDDWDVVTTSTSLIELMDVSGGNGSTDLLTFGVIPIDCLSSTEDIID